MSSEVGDSGTPHIQGFFQMKRRVGLYRAKNALDQPRASLRLAEGNAEQNLHYITKDGRRNPVPSWYKHWSWGTPCKQGQRSDMIKLRDLLKEGRMFDDLIRDDSQAKQFGNLMRYHTGIEKASCAFVVPRTTKPKSYWFSGDSQAGKSTDAFSMVEEGQTCYFKSGNNKWWPGYNGQDVVIWNDIRGGKDVDFTFLLRLLDPEAIQVQQKFGYKTL